MSDHLPGLDAYLTSGPRELSPRDQRIAELIGMADEAIDAANIIEEIAIELGGICSTLEAEGKAIETAIRRFAAALRSESKL